MNVVEQDEVYIMPEVSSLDNMIKETNDIASNQEDLIMSIEYYNNNDIILEIKELFFSGIEYIKNNNILKFCNVEYLINQPIIKINIDGVEIFRNLNNHLYVLKLINGIKINIDTLY